MPQRSIAQRRGATQAALAALLLGAALLAGSPAARPDTKDIVLDRIAGSPPPAGAPAADVLAVSVLLESPDGTLTPRSTAQAFRTGDRFRVKLLTARPAKVSFYNTNPAGELGRSPVWQGEVQPGQETISPRLRLDGRSGTDLLHVVLEPKDPSNVWDWLGNWLRRVAGSSKDISLDVQNTDSATYLVHQGGQGVVTTIAIRHR